MKKIMIVIIILIINVFLIAGCAEENTTNTAQNKNHTEENMAKADNAFLQEYPRFIQDVNGDSVPVEKMSKQAQENIKSILSILSGRNTAEIENGIGILYNEDIARVFVKTIYMQADAQDMNTLFAYEYIDKPSEEYKNEIIKIFFTETRNKDLVNALRIMVKNQDSIANFADKYINKLTKETVEDNIRSNMFYLSCSFVTYLKEQNLPNEDKILDAIVDMFFRVSNGASNILSFDKPVLGATIDETFEVMPVISPDKNYGTLIQFVNVCDRIINPYISNPEIANDEIGIPIYTYIEATLPKLIVNYLPERPVELNLVSQRVENRLLELYRLMIAMGAKEPQGTIEELSTPLEYSYAQTIGKYLSSKGISYIDCDKDSNTFKVEILNKLSQEVDFKQMIETFNNK